MGWHRRYRLAVIALALGPLLAACTSTDPFEAGDELTVDQSPATSPGRGEVGGSEGEPAAGPGSSVPSTFDQNDDAQPGEEADNGATQSTVSPQSESLDEPGSDSGGADNSSDNAPGDSTGRPGSGGSSNGSSGPTAAPVDDNPTPPVTLVPADPDGLPATE